MIGTRFSKTLISERFYVPSLSDGIFEISFNLDF